MADIQLDQGYTRIANALIEAIIKYLKNPAWIKCALWTIRITYGFHRVETESNYQAYATKLEYTKEYIKEVLIEMTSVGIIKLNPLSTERFKISIVKDFEKWKIAH